ncbi:GGDEF domain-containing protein [Bacillus sp. FJAT-29937]|uniref:GGDEF domain-containing protein n=1 Tax=Bacillus sp. FJAT-29937 TaxID=1720553 RepID=UPI00082EF9A9|nr:GGDEF domain-containing protein [Bacillus sp. FJAT-29937]
MVTVEYYAWPLFISFSFILLLCILSIHFFVQTKKYNYIGLSAAYLVSTLLACAPFFTNRLQYFDTNHIMATTGMLCSILATFIIQGPKIMKIWLPTLFLTIISVLSIFLPFPVNCLLLGLGMLSYGIYILLKGEWNGNVTLYNIHAVIFVLLGLVAIIGVFYRHDPLFFLVSLFNLTQVILASLFFFDRVVSMMRVASYNSVTDPLTKIYNKRFLINKAKQLAANQEISIIFADIDDFKKLNDSKGHEEGDRVLKEVARCLKAVVHKQGYPCRFGGEELVGIVTHGNAVEKAEKFREKVEREIGVTVSVGVSSGKGDAEKIIKDADLFMYQAKNGGKNKVVSL